MLVISVVSGVSPRAALLLAKLHSKLNYILLTSF